MDGPLHDGVIFAGMSSSATDDATASTDGPEKQVKFSLPGRSSGNINSGKNKVFSRSCSSAGVLGSLSKQQQTSLKSSSDSNASTSTSKSQHGGSGSGKNNATSSSGKTFCLELVPRGI